MACISTKQMIGGILILMGPVSGGSSSAEAPYDKTRAETEIREIERAWASVAVSGDPAVIDEIFADDFLGVSPDGAQYTKQQFIDDTKANPLGFTSNELNEMKIRFSGDVAIAQGKETFTRKDGRKGRFVWTDVLERRGGRWRIIAAQDAIAPADEQAGGTLFTGAAPPEAGTQAINRTRNAYVAAWKAADAARVAELYTEDAQVLYPNQPPLKGRAAILGYFRGFFSEFIQDDFALTSSEIVITGPWAFDRGAYRWKGTPRAGGSPVEDNGKYLVVLQQQADGSWKVHRDMDNSDRPLSQETRGTD